NLRTWPEGSKANTGRGSVATGVPSAEWVVASLSASHAGGQVVRDGPRPEALHLLFLSMLIIPLFASLLAFACNGLGRGPLRTEPPTPPQADTFIHPVSLIPVARPDRAKSRDDCP